MSIDVIDLCLSKASKVVGVGIVQSPTKGLSFLNFGASSLNF